MQSAVLSASVLWLGGVSPEPLFPVTPKPGYFPKILTCDHNVTLESRCLHWYHFIDPLGWIETERGAFAVRVPFPIGVNFASGISLSITIPFSVALTLANPVCLAAVRCADTVPDRVAIPFRLPALSAKGITFPVGRLFKPGYAVADRSAPA